MTVKTKPKTSTLHRDLMRIARKLVREHVEIEDGERCFNRFTYLEELPNAIYERLERELPFELDSYQTARFLYCCLGGLSRDGNSF